MTVPALAMQQIANLKIIRPNLEHQLVSINL